MAELGGSAPAFAELELPSGARLRLYSESAQTLGLLAQVCGEGHMLRVLYCDGGGFWLCTKRLSKGRFSAWPQGDGASPSSALLVRELQVLLWGGDPRRCDFPELWRKVA